MPPAILHSDIGTSSKQRLRSPLVAHQVEWSTAVPILRIGVGAIPQKVFDLLVKMGVLDGLAQSDHLIVLVVFFPAHGH
ncbi:hypothetical protein CSC65_05715 [Pseudoxanthomonas daejeonensis]|uniref:Uncharacterized protein n=1 Tax=Pseudoxanthomonas daejeonensis TaxID=266062 RepID=A0ABQ6Z9Y3_9GAMM|nr:hypothetical protein CSC65_05715 [Pseudoxanthomonas daejeonensis]